MTGMHGAIPDFHFFFFQYLIQFKIFFSHFCGQHDSLLYLLVQSNVLIFGTLPVEFQINILHGLITKNLGFKYLRNFCKGIVKVSYSDVITALLFFVAYKTNKTYTVLCRKQLRQRLTFCRFRHKQQNNEIQKLLIMEECFLHYTPVGQEEKLLSLSSKSAW